MLQCLPVDRFEIYLGIPGLPNLQPPKVLQNIQRALPGPRSISKKRLTTSSLPGAFRGLGAMITITSTFRCTFVLAYRGQSDMTPYILAPARLDESSFLKLIKGCGLQPITT